MNGDKSERAERYNRHAAETSALVLESLALPVGATVADVGAGGGHYTLEFARRVGGRGRVLAVDVDPDMLEIIARNAARAGLANVATIRAEEDGAGLSLPPCDLLFLRNVLHHMARPEAFLRALRPFLKTGGTAAAIDWIPGAPGPNGPRGGTAEAEILRLFEGAGFSPLKRLSNLPEQSFHLFGPDSRRGGAARPGVGIR